MLPLQKINIKLIVFCTALAVLCASASVLLYTLACWQFSDPGCSCPGQKIQLAKINFEIHKGWLPVLMVVMTGGVIGTAIKLRLNPPPLKLLVPASIVAIASLLFFDDVFHLDPDHLSYWKFDILLITPYWLVPISRIAVAPLLTWKFLFALASFVIISCIPTNSQASEKPL